MLRSSPRLAPALGVGSPSPSDPQGTEWNNAERGSRPIPSSVHCASSLARSADRVWTRRPTSPEQAAAKLGCPLESRTNQPRLSHRVPRPSHCDGQDFRFGEHRGASTVRRACPIKDARSAGLPSFGDVAASRKGASYPAAFLEHQNGTL